VKSGGKDSFRTQALRPHRRHGGAHSESPGLRRSSAHDRAAAPPGNHHRLAAQLGIVALFDRSTWTSEGNTQLLIPVRELAAWIESNILLQLASAPFDKQDATLIAEVGSCSNCPKRTGFNKLLFADVRKDSCTDPQCFRAKIDAHVAKTLEAKPNLVQISSAWNTREGAPLASGLRRGPTRRCGSDFYYAIYRTTILPP